MGKLFNLIAKLLLLFWTFLLLFAFISYINSYNNDSMNKEAIINYFQKKPYTKEPPYTMIEGRTVKVVFYFGSEIVEWTWPIDSYRKQVYFSQTLQTYNPIYFDEMIKGAIENTNDLEMKQFLSKFTSDNRYLRLKDSDTGKTYKVMNFVPYVSGHFFNDVIPSLYYKSKNDEEFIRNIWKIAGQGTMYSEEIEETPRFPTETLVEAGGDCEDTAILVASMLKATPGNYKVSLVYMDMYSPTNSQDLNHVIVWVETPSGYKTFIETTSKEEMNPYKSGVEGWYFEV